MMEKRPEYSTGEEIANSISHGLGTMLSIAGLVFLVRVAASHGDMWRVVSSSVYGASLTLLYLSSTLYHSLSESPARRFFKILDHSSVFVLIVGTYAPLSLVTLRGKLGWTLFCLVAVIGVVGILLKVRVGDRFGFYFGLIYLAMGWLVVVVLNPLMTALHPTGFKLVLYGGLTYTIGIIVYSLDRIPWNHSLWHVFVLGGSIFHYFAILLYVIGIPPS